MENSLKEFEEQQLAVISPLLVTAQELLAEATAAVVASDDDLQTAIDIKKRVTGHSKTVKDIRLDLTRPLDNVSDQLRAREREILAPLEEAKSLIAKKSMEYEAEKERKRLAEERRIGAIVSEVQALYRPGMTTALIETARTTAKKMVAELPEEDKKNSRVNLAFLTLSNRLTERENDIEVEKQRAQKKKLEDDAAKIEREKREIAAAAERQRIEQEQIEVEKAERAAEAARPKTNIREETRFEIVSPDEVDRALCEPSEKKIREAIKLGATEIAGVRIYTEKVMR